MKRKIWNVWNQKCLGLVLLMFLMLSILPVQRVKAAVQKPEIEKNHTIYFRKLYSSYTGKTSNEIDTYTKYVFTKNVASNAKVTNIKSSNKKISVDYIRSVKAFTISMASIIDIDLPDSTTLTFKVTQGGKTYNMKCKITLKLSNKSPFSSLKVGSLELVSKAKSNSNCQIDKINKAVKITAKPASEIKITGISVLYLKGQYPQPQHYKNGQKIDLKDAISIIISYQHTKSPKNYREPSSGKWDSVLSGSFSIELR